MQRTTRKERKTNARLFYQQLCSGYNDKAAIVIKRQDSKANPNISRVQFITAHATPVGSNMIIAESIDGVAGCFRELVENIHGNIPQYNYFEDGFKHWIMESCRMEIIWNDGLVIMIKFH